MVEHISHKYLVIIMPGVKGMSGKGTLESAAEVATEDEMQNIGAEQQRDHSSF